MSGINCDVWKAPLTYQGKTIEVDGIAEASLHGFGVVVVNEDCPKPTWGMSLHAEERFDADPAFVQMMKALYPQYPNDDGYTDAKIRVHLVGEIRQAQANGFPVASLYLQALSLR